MQARLPVERAFHIAGRRYLHGWVDALQLFVERLPWPWWSSYLLMWASLVTVETTAKWATGVYPVGTIFPFHLLAFALVPYALAFVHFLDREAARALVNFAPALDVEERQLKGLSHHLTTMPRSGTLLASLVGMGLGLAQRFLLTAPELDALKFATAGWLFYFELAFVPILGWALIGVFVYHAVRQIRIVDTLYRRCVRVNLFNTPPLYAFASLSARLALGVLLVCYAWLTAYPSGTSASVSQFNLTVLAVASALAIVTFLWPLWGAHQRLAAEKLSRKAAVTVRLETVLGEQHARVDAKEFASMAAINEAINGLTTELAYIEKVSTWPWQGSTLRGFLTAVFFPMLLWATQQALARLLLQ